MFISSKEVEVMVGRELAIRLCEWISIYTPVCCREVLGFESEICFDIDEAMEYAKIKMHQDIYKREFFPHLVKLKHAKVIGTFESVHSA
jgi:hypothetical protein